MRIKKFVASTIKEASEQMKAELGHEAIILNTRKIPKTGLLKSVGGEKIEITAAIDEQPLALPEPRSSQTYSRSRVKQSYDTVMKQAIEQTNDNSENVLESLRRMSETFEQRVPEKSEERSISSQTKEVSDIVQLKSDVEDVKSLLQRIAQQLQFKHFGEMPEVVKEAYLTLLQQDIDEKLILSITNQIVKKLSHDKNHNRINVEQLVLQIIANSLAIDNNRKQNSKKGKVIVLVGPTGVGKTTTIAKLAAIEKLAHGKKVALISCDTYRIGAIEQLKTFAVIADIPMQVVYRATDLPAAIKKFRRFDIIFIDTVGRSQKAKKELQELKKIVQSSHADEVHLVVSGQTNTATLNEIEKQFSVIDPTHLIFSKLDEAAIFGPLYNIAQKTKLPVSYFTTGQAVPDDICIADGTKFAAMLYQGTLAHA